MKSFFSCLFLAFFSFSLLAQDTEEVVQKITNTFNFAPVVGLVGAQIEGDRFSGFNQLGLTAGGRVEVHFHPFWAAQMEMLFTQKGSRTQIRPDNFDLRCYRLNYIEVPLLISYIDQGLRFNAGLSAGRLIGFKYLNVDGFDDSALAEGDFREFEFSFVGGGGFFLKSNIGFELRWGYSLAPATIQDRTFFQYHHYNHYVSLRMMYMLL